MVLLLGKQKNIFNIGLKPFIRRLKGSNKMVLKPIKYIYHKIQRIRRNIIILFELLFSQKLLIISSDQSGESILQLKEKSVERVYFSRIYNLNKESWVDFLYPKLEVRKYTDANVYSGSDFIISNDCAIWDKYFKPQWAKIIPQDNALLKIKDHFIFIKKAKNIKKIECGFSLCGVHCTVWAHFLVEYLPKLFILKEIQMVINHEITVIVPHYTDSQIREIVFPYLSQFKNIKVKELDYNEVANCKVLYHIENTTHLTDHANYINPSDFVISRFILDILKNNFISKFTDNFLNIQDPTQLPFRKLYIGRSGYRNMLNNAEVEQYFVGQGFEIVHPDYFSLKEKVKIFREAAIIVGPSSSGFSNMIFCKPGAKALAFINFQRTYDGYGSTVAKYFGVDVMLVTGYDQNDSIHSSYYIPLNKIKLAYQELLS